MFRKHKLTSALLAIVFCLAQSASAFGQDVIVTFDANGGTGTMSSQILTGGSGPLNACEFIAPNPSAAGNTLHTFYKWNTAADGSGTDYAVGQEVHFTSNITLYAQWYIFLDLAAGPINFTMSGDYVNYSGKVYVNGTATTISGRHVSDSKYYIYQSSTKTGNYDKTKTGYANTDDYNARRNIRVPEYAGVTHLGEAWAEFANGNKDAKSVMESWETDADIVERTATTNRITINQSERWNYDPINRYDIVIDNVWCSYDEHHTHRCSASFKIGGAQASAGSNQTGNNNQEKVTLKAKGDNRFGNIMYSQKKDGVGYLKITSLKGDGDYSGSITVGPASASANLVGGNSILGSGDNDDTRPCYGLYFNGSTVYAATPVDHMVDNDALSAVGGGTNNDGYVTINGGRLTAVARTTSAAIGGGGGFNSYGGNGYVTINGGEVYAYQLGTYSPNEIKTALPTAAIGGGSSYKLKGNSGTITINGGYVYAESVGGVAIGGGGSAKVEGGDATLTITGGTIIARSISGMAGPYYLNFGTSIGGGTGGTSSGVNGGNAIVNISGNPVFKTGSIGGGAINNSSGKIGYASATISGGDIQGQFVMAQGSSDHCTFTMTDGIIHNSSTASDEYLLVKPDGGALWMDDLQGIVTITGGSIEHCSAARGGAIYMTGGQLNVTGGKIYGNTASTNGGSAYMGGGNFAMSAGEVSGNTANVNGGGFYVNNGNITITGGDVLSNNATNGNGGGFYANGGNVDITGATINSNSAGSNGGAFFLGPDAEITLQDGSIEDNEAENGGAIYLSSGAYFEYKTSATGEPGYIRGNSATNLGGGIYLAQGTTSNKTEMKFTLSSTNLGFYDNTADVGGDDIYAYGNGTTTINIPNVQSMNLGGYSIPGATLEWWEDYKVNDSRYSEGTEQGDPSNITRYRASRDADEPIWKVPKLSTTPLSTFSEKYLCLTLGFEYGKIEIRRAGLKQNENAIYEVQFGDGSQRDIQRVIVYGSDEEGIDVDNKHWNVAKVSFLPKGQYTVTEIPWTWYNEDKSSGALTKTQDISVDNGHIFNFENAHHNLTETPLHDEEFKVNILKK